MTNINGKRFIHARRAFLQTSASAGLGLAGFSSRILGADNDVGVAIIGLGNKDEQPLLASFVKIL